MREALTVGFQRWLKDVSPNSENGSLSPGRTLDPYATSMRTSKNFVADLISVADDGHLVASDTTQRFADLRRADLVQGDHEAPALTDLGDAVLNNWRQLGIANEDEEYEVARAIVLARAGSERSDSYREMRQFWKELRQVRPPNQWFENPYGLYLVSYLDRASTDGYRPLAVLEAAGVDGWDDMATWHSWAEEFEAPAGWQESRLHKLIRTVNGFASRARGRVTFCQALEAVHLAQTAPVELEPALTDWGISDAEPAT